MASAQNQLNYELSKLRHPRKLPLEVINYLDTGRFALREDFLQRPALNAVLALADASGGSGPNAAAFAAYTIANRNFEVLGTNMTTALCTFSASGGITLTTATAANDQAIVLPHLDTNQSAWSSTNWLSQKSPTFEASIVTGASVAATTIWAGFKLTNTSVVATDDDQAFFRYNAATASGAWQVITSRSGTDTTTTVSTGAIAAPVASTAYRLRIALNAAMQPRFWINGAEVLYNGLGSVFPALTTAISFIPYIGVQTTTTAAKAIDVRGLICSRV